MERLNAIGRHDRGGNLRLDGLPVEQAPAHMLNRNRPRVVVRLVALVRGAVVPRVPPLRGEPDQGLSVEGFESLARHDDGPFLG
jgi:hypothetical protein